MPPKFAAAAEPKKRGRKPSVKKLNENKSNENKSIEKKSSDTNDGDEEDIGFQILSMTNQNKLKNSNGKSKIEENVIDLSFGSSGSDNVNVYGRGSRGSNDNKTSLDADKIKKIKQLVMNRMNGTQEEKTKGWSKCVSAMNKKLIQLRTNKSRVVAVDSD